jgi:hypothetical protein
VANEDRDAVGPSQSMGSAPDPGHGEIGEAPKPRQTIGDAPAGGSGGRGTPLLIGGGVALLAIIAVIVAFVSR